MENYFPFSGEQVERNSFEKKIRKKCEYHSPDDGNLSFFSSVKTSVSSEPKEKDARQGCLMKILDR